MKRYQLELTARGVLELDDLADELNTDRLGVIRRALGLMKILHREVINKPGNSLAIADENFRVEKKIVGWF